MPSDGAIDDQSQHALKHDGCEFISHKPAHAVPNWQAPASTEKNLAGQQQGARGGGHEQTACVETFMQMVMAPP